MKYVSVFRLASYFSKKAQEASLDSSDNVTQEDMDFFKGETAKVMESANTVAEWAAEISTNTNDPKLMELDRFAQALSLAANSLNGKAKAFLNSTDENKTITTVDSDVNAVMNNYNALHDNHLDDSWIQQNNTFDESKAMDQIEQSMTFVKDFVQKQKNAEANRGSEPSLPT